jgi:hypothetical protein
MTGAFLDSWEWDADRCAPLLMETGQLQSFGKQFAQNHRELNRGRFSSDFAVLALHGLSVSSVGCDIR